MKAVAYAFVAALLLVGSATAGYEVGANPTPPACTPKSCEMTPLQQAQMDLKLERAKEAANTYQQQVNDLNSFIEQVKTENHWPATATYNGQIDKFVMPAPAVKGKK